MSDVRCATLIVQLGGMAWSQTGAAHYHAQQGPPDKDCAIKELFVCYVVMARCVGLFPGCGKLKYRNNPLETIHSICQIFQKLWQYDNF